MTNETTLPNPAPAVPGIANTEPGRRRFLDALMKCGFVSTAIAIAYPVSRYHVPPVTDEPTTESVVAGRLADLQANSGMVFKFGSQPALLVRTPGKLTAVSATCTHLGCTVKFKPETGQLYCPCHKGIYDLAGNVVAGPPPRPLERYAVRLRGRPGQEEIVVSRT
jgi:cytochrome b6-f complex iron-sulfur subunit